MTSRRRPPGAAKRLHCDHSRPARQHAGRSCCWVLPAAGFLADRVSRGSQMPATSAAGSSNLRDSTAGAALSWQGVWPLRWPAQRVGVSVCLCHLAAKSSRSSFGLLPAGSLLVQRGGRGHRDPPQALQGGHARDDGGDAAGVHPACPDSGAAQGCTPLAGGGGAGSARGRAGTPEVTAGQSGSSELVQCVEISAEPSRSRRLQEHGSRHIG